MPRIRYYVEPDVGQYSQEETETVYTQLGWKILGEYRGVFLVYKTADPLSVRPEKTFEEKDLDQRKRNLWFGLLFWFLTSLYSVYKIFSERFSSGIHFETWNVYGMTYCITVVLITVFLICELINHFYNIIVWNRCVLQRKAWMSGMGILVLRKLRIFIIWSLILAGNLLLFLSSS